MIDYSRINTTLGKMGYYLSTHNCICVGVSGGSDSTIIVHMIAKYYREHLHKIHFVFNNTGLEYRATLDFLGYLESTYGIHIHRIRGESVVSAVRNYGVPILSKEFSKLADAYGRGVKWACKRIDRTRQDSPYGLSDKQRSLAEYIAANHVLVSSRCCEVSKKIPYHRFCKSVGADLEISGERRSEGGQRSSTHKSCFESKDNAADKYMPLFFWDDETKQYYKEHEQIRYSDCYEVWGMKRTGCVGCPCNSKIGEDLLKIKEHEPTLYRACISVFGRSYQLMDMFSIRKHKILPNNE